MFPISRAFAGAGAGAVLERSMPADLGPSATSVMQVNYFILFSLTVSHILIAGMTGGTVALRRRPLGDVGSKSGRSKKSPAGEIPAFRRAAPENVVTASFGSLEATSF